MTSDLLRADPAVSARGSAGRHVADTTPYAWPWDGDLRPSRLALVVAGAQRSFVSDPSPEVMRTIADCICAVRAVGAPVIVLRHLRPGAAVRPVLPRAGSLDATSLFPDADAVVDCHGVDGFASSPLDPVLRALGADQLLLVGLGLETAVHSTMRSANDRGYECLLVEDACASPIEAATGLRAGAVSSICMSGGIFGAVGKVRAVTDALRGLRPVQSPPEERPLS